MVALYVYEQYEKVKKNTLRETSNNDTLLIYVLVEAATHSSYARCATDSLMPHLYLRALCSMWFMV